MNLDPALLTPQVVVEQGQGTICIPAVSLPAHHQQTEVSSSPIRRLKPSSSSSGGKRGLATTTTSAGAGHIRLQQVPAQIAIGGSGSTQCQVLPYQVTTVGGNNSSSSSSSSQSQQQMIPQFAMTAVPSSVGAVSGITQTAQGAFTVANPVYTVQSVELPYVQQQQQPQQQQQTQQQQVIPQQVQSSIQVQYSHAAPDAGGKGKGRYANESPEKRRARLAKDAERKRIKRAQESAEDYKARLAKGAEYVRKKRSLAQQIQQPLAAEQQDQIQFHSSQPFQQVSQQQTPVQVQTNIKVPVAQMVSLPQEPLPLAATNSSNAIASVVTLPQHPVHISSLDQQLLSSTGNVRIKLEDGEHQYLGHPSLDGQESPNSLRLRAGLNDSERRLAREAERMRNVRANESTEDRAKRLAAVAERNRMIRANESEDDKKRRLSQNAERMRKLRANEGMNQREVRLHREAERARLRRANESPDTRRKRLEIGRMRSRLRRANEKSRRVRLDREAARVRVKRSHESPDSRRRRLQRDIERRKLRNESPGQAQKRRERNRIYMAKKRAGQLPSQQHPSQHVVPTFSTPLLELAPSLAGSGANAGHVTLSGGHTIHLQPTTIAYTQQQNQQISSAHHYQHPIKVDDETKLIGHILELETAPS